jgi:hypothetical protein
MHDVVARPRKVPDGVRFAAMTRQMLSLYGIAQH